MLLASGSLQTDGRQTALSGALASRAAGEVVELGFAFTHAAWILKLSIADVERCHAKNRKRSHPQNQFDLLAARFVNGELRNRVDARRRLIQEQERQQQLQAQTSAPSGPTSGRAAAAEQPPCLKRKRSALQLFHADRCKESLAMRRVMGVIRSPASSEFWDDVKRDFTLLSEDEGNRYEERSRATGPAARLGYVENTGTLVWSC